MFQDFCASFLGYVREEFKQQLVSALVVAAVFGRYRSLTFFFWLRISASAFTFRMTSLRSFIRKLVTSHTPLEGCPIYPLKHMIQIVRALLGRVHDLLPIYRIVNKGNKGSQYMF